MGPRPRWGMLDAIEPITVMMVLIVDHWAARSPVLDTVVVAAGFLAAAGWLRRNAAALDQVEWCESSPRGSPCGLSRHAGRDLGPEAFSSVTGLIRQSLGFSGRTAYHGRMTPRIRYERLATERLDPRSRGLDRLSPVEVARLMNRADREAVRAVARAAPMIARAVEMVVQSLARGGRLIFVGAGTSGRLGVLEAAECPPTFGTLPAMVQAVIAGGRRAVFRSVEGAEDAAAEGARQIRRRARSRDVVVGIAASGVTPFVRAALREARRRGAATALVTCNPRVAPRIARVVIPLAVGPEVLAGSTRLKAGTATKLTLNTLTTAVFARLGRVYGNRMVDVRPRSAKLLARARRLVREIGRVGEREAARLLGAAGGNAKVAIVMARLEVGSSEARRMLRAASGSLRRLLG